MNIIEAISKNSLTEDHIATIVASVGTYESVKLSKWEKYGKSRVYISLWYNGSWVDYCTIDLLTGEVDFSRMSKYAIRVDRNAAMAEAFPEIVETVEVIVPDHIEAAAEKMAWRMQLAAEKIIEDWGGPNTRQHAVVQGDMAYVHYSARLSHIHRNDND